MFNFINYFITDLSNVRLAYLLDFKLSILLDYHQHQKEQVVNVNIKSHQAIKMILEFLYVKFRFLKRKQKKPLYSDLLAQIEHKTQLLVSYLN